MADSPRRIRTFSSSNIHASNRVHEYVSSQQKKGSQEVNLAREVTKSSMVFPTLRKILLERSALLPRYTVGLVTDTNAMDVLEKEGIINWCEHARTLIPLNTDSDGNCLLHSLSIYIWGIHDRHLNLRSFLHQKLTTKPRADKLYHRWKSAQEESLRDIEISFGSMEMRRDWEAIVNSSAPVEFPMGNRGHKYYPLEDIHIFTMSNVLARPIIVLSERVHHGMNGGSLQQNQISGIYLPLLRDPLECERSPVVIGYLQGHFMPLLSGEDLDMLITKRPVNENAQHCIPLVYNDLTNIPVRFLLPHEERFYFLKRYMDCISIPVRGEAIKEAVILKFRSPPAWSVELMFSLYCKAQEAFREHYTPVPGAGRIADGFAASVSTTASDVAYNFREQATHLSRLSTNQAYSQAVVSTTAQNWRSTDDTWIAAQSSAERRLCRRAQYGCGNIGEERYNRLCWDCYNAVHVGMSPGNIHDHKDRSDPYILPQRPPTSFASQDRRITEPPGAAPLREPITTTKCIIPRCENVSKLEFNDMCENCYRERRNRPAVSGSSEIRPGATGVSGKVFCADPGCQEEIVEGTDRCEDHLHNRPDCITENCGKKAVDNEIPLCSECRRKNVEACNAQLPKSAPITEPEFLATRTQSSSKPDFLTPAIYPGFNKATVRLPPRSEPQTEYHQPEWQTGLDRQRLPSRMAERVPEWQYGARMCSVQHCENFAANGKDGLCNECFDLKMRIREVETESRLSEMNPGRSRQQYLGEAQRASGSSVSAAVRSQISSQMRRAAQMGAPPSAQLSPTRKEDWHSDDQGALGMRRNSERNFPIEGERGQRTYASHNIYENERNREAHRNYNSQRNSDVEHIYSEIDPVHIDREVGYAELAARRPASGPTSSGMSRDPTRTQGGFVNGGYMPSIYSGVEETGHKGGRCVDCGGVRSCGAELGGLCENCHAKSKREREQDKFQTPRKPFINPRPCKTRGCPRFAEGSNGDLCETCLHKSGRTPSGSVAPSSSVEASSSYAGSMDTGRREASSAERKQPSVCVSAFCDFYASGEFGPFCSKCFMENTKLDVGNPAPGGDPLESFADSQRWSYIGRGSTPGGKACRREGCDHFGRPERNGYCNQCFELFQ